MLLGEKKKQFSCSGTTEVNLKNKADKLLFCGNFLLLTLMNSGSECKTKLFANLLHWNKGDRWKL